MSLERNTAIPLIDEKNPLDTSSSVNFLNSSLLARGIEGIYSPDISVDMYALGMPIDTQKSSQFSDLASSQVSMDYKFLKLPEEGGMNDTKKTMIEKSGKNEYNILIDSLQEISLKSSSQDFNDENLNVGSPQVKVIRDSTIYTSLSEDSFHGQNEPLSPQVLEEKRENLQDVARSKKNIGNRPAASIRNSTFALTNRIFCMKCNVNTFTNVSFQMKDMNLWGNINFFFTAIKCCGEPRALSRYQDIVHSCKKCGSVVARISTV
jgi:hypothetical protein